MTIRLKTKIVRKRALRLKVIQKIPANLVGANGISIVKTNGTYTATPDYSSLAELLTFDPTKEFVLVSSIDGTCYKVAISTLINNSSSTIRVVTEAGDITVGINTRILIMNRTANETPSRILLPASSSKVGGIKIVDWKGNAGAFPHTIYPNGVEKINGNQATWTIWGDNGSAILDPVSGLGYAV